MELSSPKIKKFLIFYNRNLSFILIKPLIFFLKKSRSEKISFISLYFGKWNLLAVRLKSYIIFSQNSFSYIS